MSPQDPLAFGISYMPQLIYVHHNEILANRINYGEILQLCALLHDGLQSMMTDMHQ